MDRETEDAGEAEPSSTERINAAVEVTAREVAAKATQIGVQLNPQTLLFTQLEIITELLLADMEAEDQDAANANAQAQMALMVQRRILERLEEAEADQRAQELLAGTGGGNGPGGLILPGTRPSRQVRRANAREMAKRLANGGGGV